MPKKSVSAAGPLKVIEFFAGIGGLSAAWPEANVLAAFDINVVAKSLYEQNFASPYHICTIESLELSDIPDADVWWMSPPCQPFTRKGKRLDLADPRSSAFKRLVHLAAIRCPPILAIENVVGFEQSDAFAAFTSALQPLGYETTCLTICPTQFGWPNLRPRVYVLASRQSIGSSAWLPRFNTRIPSLLDRESDHQALRLSDELFSAYRGALDLVDETQEEARTACFAASYGKVLLRSGSYLQFGHGARRFSPREVARFLGYSNEFALQSVSDRQAWKLLGNSLSLISTRYALSHLPGGPDQPLQQWFDHCDVSKSTRGIEFR